MAVPGSGRGSTISRFSSPRPFSGEAGWLRTLQGQRTLTLFGFGPDAMDGQVSWKGRGIVVRHKPQGVVARIRSSQDRIAQEYGRKKPVRSADGKARSPVDQLSSHWRLLHGYGCQPWRGGFQGRSVRPSRSVCCRRLDIADHDDRGAAAQRLCLGVLDRRANREGRMKKLHQ